MNALLAVVKDKKNILIANEGRLLKKCLLGVIIFSFSFQSGEFGQIIRQTLIDAYLQVSVFVGITLFVFLGLDYITKFNTTNFLEKTRKFHVVISAVLGSIPGCGGAIIVVTQYIQGKLSFGCLVAVLTSTMGDAAFLLLAKEPSQGLFVFLVAGMTGILSGYLVDIIHKKKYSFIKKKITIEFESIKNTFVSKFNYFWILIFIPGFICGVCLTFQINIQSPNALNEFDYVNSIGSIGALISIFMWTLNPLSDIQCSTEKSRSLSSRVIDTTNFVTTWVVCAFILYESLIFFSQIDLRIFFDVWIPFVPLIAILFGFVPGCGPQIVVTTFYLNGSIPFSAELGNAISNDGDALFPAIALAPKAAIIATLYSAIPAIIVAYSYMYFFE